MNVMGIYIKGDQQEGEGGRKGHGGGGLKYASYVHMK
jgi:hypothetical protein